mmetsp:Transcript_36907/g.83215  ORF Transcript_36907/g.83215 Transcript_36907/m.83215 type:complete len:138 (+) Transcript_36907:191-604(+)
MCSFQKPKKSTPTCSHGTCALVGFCIKERQLAKRAASMTSACVSDQTEAVVFTRVPLAVSHPDVTFHAAMTSAPSVVLEKEMTKMELHTVSEEHLACEDLDPSAHLVHPGGAQVFFPMASKAVEEVEKQERLEQVNC